MEAGVRGEVGLDGRVVVGGTLDLVGGEIIPDGGPEEVVVLGVIAGTRASGAGKVAGEDLFLEAVEGVGDALEILEVGHANPTLAKPHFVFAFASRILRREN